MTKLFVKICGITRLQDAELASALGADAIGFVFWPGSPRYLAPEAAKAIAERLPSHVVKVGVFVDEDVEQVRSIMDAAGLDCAQLHGHEPPAYCRTLGRKIIKAIPMRDDGAADVMQFEPDVVLLVDAHDDARHGGTGRTVNWDAAREIAVTRPTILAGGLNAANIKLAVRSVRPYGIDVSSGVESAPGVKDPARLRSLFEALHD
ncbi:MAG TPA: phosphoribosylanthranilate isomerase [Vicinamibacterales bacterium]|nr:phosphoribosylanthranilate isomerase [Vicinamibacterales bacterium]